MKKTVVKKEQIVVQKLLSKKEAAFVADYIRTGNGTEAAMRNCKLKNRNSAAVTSSRMLRSVKVLEVIKRYRDRIPEDLLIEKHLELLNAKRKIRSYKKGELVFEAEEIDSAAVSKGLDMAYSIKGYYEQEPLKDDTGPNETLESINILIKALKENRLAKSSS